MKLLLFLPLFIALSIFAFSQTPRGRVQIHNGTLVTDSGTLLRGCYISTDGNWPMTPIKEDIKTIKDFGLNTIHLYAENSCCQFPGEKEADIDSIVKWTENDSLYLILTVGSWGGSDLEWISAFWKKYALKYKDKTHVIFEISNEPFEWSAPYDSATLAMEKSMYDTIRFYAPETHIQFMSYALNSNIDSAIADIKSLGQGINWENASIAVHGYVHSSETNRVFMKTLQDSGFAVTVTEVPVIRARNNGSIDQYANLAMIRVCEEEFISYVNFLVPNDLTNKPYVYKSKIENSEIRWIPDFGTWPANLHQINFINPYSLIFPGFYDEAAHGVNHDYDFKIYVIDTIHPINPYIAFYNLDFKDGPVSLLIETSYMQTNSRAEVHLDSLNGTQIGLCQLPISEWDKDVVFSCPVTNIKGIHNIYLVLKSETYFCGIINNILFIKPGINSKQPPYIGNAFVIPGKIEAEEYDIGGINISYFDNTLDNEGLQFRFDEVDIETTTDINLGYNVGWIENGEWLEYTVDCMNESVNDIQLRIACIEPGEKIRIKLNNQILGTVSLPNTGGYQIWETLTLDSISIPAGENQILRLEFLGSGFNLNWLNFIAKDKSGILELYKNKNVIFYPNPAHDYIKTKTTEPVQVEIYSMQGQLLIKKKIFTQDDQIPVHSLSQGSYVTKISTDKMAHSEILIIE